MQRDSPNLQSREVSGHRAPIETASSELTRDINRDLILERIRSLQPISRVDLARASGLQPSTVSSIVEQLLEEKWIEEGASIRTSRGRRPTMLCLNRSSAMLVADVRPLHAVLAVVDLNGQILSRQAVPLGSDARQGTGAIAAGMRVLRQSFPEKTFEGVGLSMPGRVNPENSRLILAPNLRWSNFDIRRTLARQLGLPVALENAANACLLSEIWFGHMDGVRNALLITISEGLGAAILADRRLITGHAGLAGEFGHVCFDPSGPRCGCGQKGCWEMYASSSAALRYLCEITGSKKKLNISELIALALDGNPAAIKAIRKQAIAIGVGLRIVTAAVSPEIILFAGDITAFWDAAQAIIQKQCQDRMLAGKPPRLVSIGDGETARLRGAAALVLQRHSNYYRANHDRNAAKKQSTQRNSSMTSVSQL
jgi:predicted NBD/HSP70 family sugar kinase